MKWHVQQFRKTYQMLQCLEAKNSGAHRPRSFLMRIYVYRRICMSVCMFASSCFLSMSPQIHTHSRDFSKLIYIGMYTWRRMHVWAYVYVYSLCPLAVCARVHMCMFRRYEWQVSLVWYGVRKSCQKVSWKLGRGVLHSIRYPAVGVTLQSWRGKNGRYSRGQHAWARFTSGQLPRYLQWHSGYIHIGDMTQWRTAITYKKNAMLEGVMTFDHITRVRTLFTTDTTFHSIGRLSRIYTCRVYN